MERRDILSAGLIGSDLEQPVLRAVQPTRSDIVERIAGAALRAVADRGDHEGGWPRPAGPLKPAAVLVPIIERLDGFTILLTQRTAHLSDHAGQISFPGGRIEPDDPTPEHAALREAVEETGLSPHLVEIVGRLPFYVTGTGFEIVPVVGLVHPELTLLPDPFEVADIFEIPLSFVLDHDNHHRRSRLTAAGGTASFYVLPFQDRNIWGATAGMLVNLAEILTRTPTEMG